MLDEINSACQDSIEQFSDLRRADPEQDGADDLDAAGKACEADQERSVVANRLDLLAQTQRALDRIDAGTYGICENCGAPIPKARLHAFPAATLDVSCKRRAEQR